MNENRKPKALAKFLDVSLDELHKEDEDMYGLESYTVDGIQYAIGNDEEVNTAAFNAIGTSLWTFNAEEILDYCGLPRELTEMLEKFLEIELGDANEVIRKTLDRCGDSLDFANGAIKKYGRGHFISSLNKENEEEFDDIKYYIYEI